MQPCFVFMRSISKFLKRPFLFPLTTCFVYSYSLKTIVQLVPICTCIYIFYCPKTRKWPLNAILEISFNESIFKSPGGLCSKTDPRNNEEPRCHNDKQPTHPNVRNHSDTRHFLIRTCILRSYFIKQNEYRISRFQNSHIKSREPISTKFGSLVNFVTLENLSCSFVSR